jgi:hypothetical protein
MSDEKQLILGTSEIQALPEDPNDRLLMLAIQGNLDVEKLSQLIELKNRQEERQAKQEFDRNFAEMQRQFRPVARTKKTDKAKYAPIEELQKEYGPIIADHGFSYRWSEDSLSDGGLRVTLHISGYGHTADNHKDLPVYEPDKGTSTGKPIMNSLQAEGARSTYGRRYTFIAGFGLIIEDEDTDGNFDDGVAYSAYIRKMDEEKDQNQLLKLSREMYSQLKKEGDHHGAEVIMRAYNRRKGAL